MNYTNWVVKHEISLTSVMVIFRTPLDPLKVEGERKNNKDQCFRGGNGKKIQYELHNSHCFSPPT